MPRLSLRLLRSACNIVLLFAALVIAPLLALTHFNAGLGAMLGDFADNYLPNPTLLSKQKKARASAESRLREKRIAQAHSKSVTKRSAVRSSKIINNKGKRVLLRGAGALAVGWVPVIGVTADIASLTEDYADICELFSVMDGLLAMLYLPDANLYEENYCHVPDQGVQMVKDAALETEFLWE